MPEMCPFCATAKEEGRILKEGKYAYVIFSNPRLMPGHLLVVPKRHVEGRLADLSREEREEIFELLVEFQGRILEKLSAGCDVKQSYKPYAQKNRTHVNHLHFHLYPREYEDELYRQADIHKTLLYQDLSDEECEHLICKLKRREE